MACVYIYIYISVLHRVICRAGTALVSWFTVSGTQGSGKTGFVLLDFGKQDVARKKSDNFLKREGNGNQLWVCYTDGRRQMHR